jgi:hypothetical protein
MSHNSQKITEMHRMLELEKQSGNQAVLPLQFTDEETETRTIK